VKSPLRFLVAFLALGLAACSTVGSRLEEKPGVFAKLDPAAQAKIKQGIRVLFKDDKVAVIDQAKRQRWSATVARH
jgi:starvation-inducible outer membrane lipoprotein